MTHHAHDQELEALEGEELPDREVMSIVSPVPDGDLVFIEPDPGAEPSDQQPLPAPPGKGEPPHIDW